MQRPALSANPTRRKLESSDYIFDINFPYRPVGHGQTKIAYLVEGGIRELSSDTNQRKFSIVRYYDNSGVYNFNKIININKDPEPG